MSEILSPEKVAAFKSIAEQYHIGALQEMCEGYEELRTRMEAAEKVCEKYKKWSDGECGSVVVNDAIKAWEEAKK